MYVLRKKNPKIGSSQVFTICFSQNLQISFQKTTPIYYFISTYFGIALRKIYRLKEKKVLGFFCHDKNLKF